MTRPRLLLALFAAALLGAGGWWAMRTTQRQRTVAQYLPTTPSLQGWPAELGTRLADAEAEARGWRRAPDGLDWVSCD